jgi:4-hydroxybenzoate polyprenyltransferase
MTRGEARLFVALACAAFVLSASRLGPVCLALSPVALAIVFWYSLAKRVTHYTQVFLGLAMAVAPVGGWIAAGGPWTI